MLGINVSTNTIGFLTVVETGQGLVGGYLILNELGLPLEFHCTASVQPSRAQQILYGRALEPFLYGQQIGATLVNKSSHQPIAVLVNLPQAIHVRQYIELPTACVVDRSIASYTATTANWIEISVQQNCLLLPPRNIADREVIFERLAAINELFDLSEPFNRIREAIEEAQRTMAKAA